MSYRLSSHAFDQPEIAALLKRLAVHFGRQGIPFYIVGAMARDLVLGMIHERKPARKTNDLDIAIMIQNWTAYEKASAELAADADFTKSKSQKQRWYYKQQLILDIIPFGEIAKADKHIYWPPDETMAMSVSGFSAMASAALEVIIDDEALVGVASLPGLFILKLSAWKDRHQETDRDAEDIGGLLAQYLEINMERAAQEHSDIFEDEAFTEFAASALLMGRDIRHLLADDLALCDEIRSILADELDRAEESRLIQKILEADRSKRYDEVRGAFVLLESSLRK